jgi:hypothetical protein
MVVTAVATHFAGLNAKMGVEETVAAGAPDRVKEAAREAVIRAVLKPAMGRKSNWDRFTLNARGIQREFFEKSAE